MEDDALPMQQLVVANATDLIDTMIHNATTMTTTSNTSSGNDEAYYEADKVALILPRITAMISLLAVVCVALEAWKDVRVSNANRSMTSQVSSGNRIRSSTTTSNNGLAISCIQLFYQIPLFCHALAFALGTTTAPQGLDVWGAIGTTKTCEAQGFLLQFGIFGNVGWDVALSTAYLVMVRYHSSTSLLGWERYYHAIIWPFVLIVCIYPLVQDMYNFNHSVCWLESYPNDCVGDECIRGEGASMMQTIASFVGVLHLLYSIAVMVCIYCSIRRLERTTLKPKQQQSGSSTTTNEITDVRRYSRAVGIQGMWYASGMIITTLPTAIYIALYNFTGLWSPAFGTFATSMTPLMGYVNFCIFMRGRRVEDCHTRYAKQLRRAHWWLWDSEWVCHCHCTCRTRRGPQAEDDTASTTIPHPPGKLQHWPDPKKELSVQENNIDTEAALMSVDSLAGAMIIPPSKDHHDDYISDLGASGLSTYSSGFVEGSSDSPPMQPIRLKSQAETPPLQPRRVESIVAPDPTFEVPPCKPTRYISSAMLSEVSEEEVDCLRPPSKQQAPPTQPVRVASQVLALDDEDDDRQNEQLRQQQHQMSAPPSKPVQFVSEILSEVEDDSSSSEDVNCNVGKARSRVAPPAKPLRLISEVSELSSSEEDDDTIRLVQSLPRKEKAPVRPIRLESEVPHKKEEVLSSLTSTNVPPSKPLRVESEAENHSCYPPSSAAPSIPMRRESLVEM